jgi:uncharacterized damage-inducible protein DinB
MPAVLKIDRPVAGEFAPYYGRYIDQVTYDDVMPLLETQNEETQRRLGKLDDSRAMHRYATGKWSVKEVVQHMIDVERVFSYRALRFARNDSSELPGFDENLWAPEAHADLRAFRDLLEEFAAVRRSSVTLFRSFEPDMLLRRGVASKNVMSVRALAWVIVGHELHHLKGLRDHYGIG